jgi:hypothetical protein
MKLKKCLASLTVGILMVLTSIGIEAKTLDSGPVSTCSLAMQSSPGLEASWSFAFDTVILLDSVPWEHSRWFTGFRIKDIWLKISTVSSRTQIIIGLMKTLRISRAEAMRLLDVNLSQLDGQTIPISTVLPPIVRERTNIASDEGNCFNAVEVFLFPERSVRNMPLFEFNSFVEEFLQPVTLGRPSLGDIMLVKDEYGDIMHAAVVITPRFVWHKPSAFRDPWTFESVDNALAPYREVEGDDLQVEYWKLKNQ